MTLMIDPAHIWNVIDNARSNRTHLPTSPKTAPATKNDSHDWFPSHMKRHLQCTEQQAASSNLTKYCACHAKLQHSTQMHTNLKEICQKRLKRHLQCAADSTMIRTWDRSRTRSFAEVTFRSSETHFVLEITAFRAPAIYPNFTKCCPCHEKWRCNTTKCCACHELQHHQFLRLPRNVTFQHQQMLRLPRKVRLSWLIPLTYETSVTMRGATALWIVNFVNSYLTELVVLRNCYFTELLL